MPFKDDEPIRGPLALPNGFDLNPDAEESDASVMGAAFRIGSPVVSALNSFDYDRSVGFDPEYRPYEEIQGTVYEGFSDRFVNARNRDQVAQMKSQIDRELEDRQALEAAGGWGVLAEMGASILSPSMLLPGGAVVRGVGGGVSIGRTAVSVAGASALAVTLDEIALQDSQQTRSGLESAVSIGGGVLLGGLLGSAAGVMSRGAFARSAASAEQIPADIVQFNDQLRSVGAAENMEDYTIRREELFQFMNQSQFRVEERLAQFMPERLAAAIASPLAVLRPAVRSDPILRAILSENIRARRALVDLVETPMQFKANEEGRTVTSGSVPVETAVKTRRNTELASGLGTLKRAYQEYFNDGPVGLVGRVNTTLTGASQRILGMSEKMSPKEFNEAVGEAMMRGDTHAIPQVQQAAQHLRREIFERAKMDAIETGLFDESLDISNAESYFMRNYNREKIEQHVGDGTEDDISVVLRSEFERKRTEAQNRLEQDDTLERAQDELAKAREKEVQTRKALRNLEKKVKGKRDRAKAAIKRETRVNRVTDALERDFRARAKKLREGLMQGEERAAFQKIVDDARRAEKLEPTSILPMIRAMGGIKDPRVRNSWRRGDWVNDGTRTDLEEILDNSAVTIRRNDGLEPDMMREALEEAGYLAEGSTVDDMLKAIRNEAGGEKVYSDLDAFDLDVYRQAMKTREAFESAGIDISKPLDNVISQLEGMARSPKIAKAKAQEADRSAGRAKRAGGTGQTLMAAIQRLDDANARLKELQDDIGPRVKEDITNIRKEIADNIKAVAKAKEQRSTDEFFANADDLEIQDSVDSTIQSIVGMKVGQHSITESMSSPRKARVLDVSDEKLMPWLEKDAGIVLGQYFNSIIPDIEMMRKFGDLNMTEQKRQIMEEGQRLAKGAKLKREKVRHQEEAKARVREFEAMADRISGRFGVPDNPKDAWVRGSRIARTVSYMGYLGGMTISAIPDVAGLVGRNGIEAAFGSVAAVTDPKRMGLALKDAKELGAAAEWYLNSRALMLADIADQYGSNTAIERAMGAMGTTFGKATGMVQWNAGWKTVGVAFAASRMSKAAMAVKAGNATKKQLVALSESGVDTVMAQRIADQIEKYGDMDGDLWLPKGGDWDDAEAFNAFRNAMNREADLMVVTPGQDKPISWSTPTGAFFTQFKSFGLSAHHRILLSGIQRSDANVLAQFTMAMLLGRFVSNVKAWQHGEEPKDGAAAWEDALDRSGLTGWLMEVQGIANAMTGGRLSVSGETVSRFRSRSELEGLLGPNVDLILNAAESAGAVTRGEVSENDARKLLRVLPGNNLPYIMGLTKEAAKSMSDVLSD